MLPLNTLPPPPPFGGGAGEVRGSQKTQLDGTLSIRFLFLEEKKEQNSRGTSEGLGLCTTALLEND